MIIHSNIICCYKVYVHAAISEPIDEDTTIPFFFCCNSSSVTEYHLLIYAEQSYRDIEAIYLEYYIRQMNYNICSRKIFALISGIAASEFHFLLHLLLYWFLRFIVISYLQYILVSSPRRLFNRYLPLEWQSFYFWLDLWL